MLEAVIGQKHLRRCSRTGEIIHVKDLRKSVKGCIGPIRVGEDNDYLRNNQLRRCCSKRNLRVVR